MGVLSKNYIRATLSWGGKGGAFSGHGTTDSVGCSPSPPLSGGLVHRLCRAEILRLSSLPDTGQLSGCGIRVLTLYVLLFGFVFLSCPGAGPALAGVSGPCANCHTMHNSQAWCCNGYPQRGNRP